MADRSAPAAALPGTTAVLDRPELAEVADTDAPWVPPTWDDVVRQHADRVYRLAFRLTGDAQEIDCRYEGIKGLVLRAEFVRKH